MAHSDTEHATRFRQGVSGHVGEELLQTVHMRDLAGIVAQLAEIPRPILMDDVGRMLPRSTSVPAASAGGGTVPFSWIDFPSNGLGSKPCWQHPQLSEPAFRSEPHMTTPFLHYDRSFISSLATTEGTAGFVTIMRYM
jgi:hypothetical protein